MRSLNHKVRHPCCGYNKQDWSVYTEKGIKISHISREHCAGCSRGREVGVVSCGWLTSTVFNIHNGLDR